MFNLLIDMFLRFPGGKFILNPFHIELVTMSKYQGVNSKNMLNSKIRFKGLILLLAVLFLQFLRRRD